MPSSSVIRLPRPLRPFVKMIVASCAVLAVFELGRLSELNAAAGRRVSDRTASRRRNDVVLVDVVDPPVERRQHRLPDDEHIDEDDSRRRRRKNIVDRDNEPLVAAADPDAADGVADGAGAAAAADVKQDAVVIAVNDEDRDAKADAANNDAAVAVDTAEERRLPDDFWNGRLEDDIVVDTDRPIINPHPFRRTLDAPSLCGGDSHGSGVFLLCYVHTAVDHFKRRARIRETWGRQANYANVTIRTVFLTGLTDKASWLQDALEYESRKYGDVVQEDFLDTYKNLSYKGIAALRWISTYCHRAAYVLKTDDDMFVNMFAMLKHLKDLHSAGYRRRILMCYVWWKMHVLRDGQWGIPKEDMPDDLYPVYCSGMGYIFTTDVAVAMYRVSYYERFFWVDDVYISGCLPRALRGAVNHTELSSAYCGAHEMSVYWHPTEWTKYVFTHVHDDELYMRTWNNLVEMARNNDLPTPAVLRPGQLAEQYIPKKVLFPEHSEKMAKKRAAERERKEKIRQEKEDRHIVESVE